MSGYIAKSADGLQSVIVSVDPSPQIVFTSGARATTLTTTLKDSGKRKYNSQDGVQIAEVKPSDSGFKVRTPDATLLWKIKLYEDKIKISDNEENRNPWVLKTGYPDKVKVLDPAETEIGVVRFAKEDVPLRVRGADGNDAWIVESGPASASWGVLLMGAIPEEQKAIIISELISRQR